jgi:hypothetical protein
MGFLLVYRNKQLATFSPVKGLMWMVTVTRKRSQQRCGLHQLFIHCAVLFASDPPADLHAPNTVILVWIDTCFIDISDILWQRNWNANLSPRENSAMLLPIVILWSLVSALIAVRLETALDDCHVLAKFPALRVNLLILLSLDMLVMHFGRYQLTSIRFDAWSGRDMQ